MKRRTILKNFGFAAGSLALSCAAVKARFFERKNGPRKVLTVAHITDIHIRPEYDAPNRLRKCLEEIKNHKIDFFLNGGDAIYAADYDNIKRQRVAVQWQIWQRLRNEFLGYEMHFCLGIHDMWWGAIQK